MKISIKEAYHWDMESFLRLHELMDEITIDDNSILSLLKAILDNDPIRIINGGIIVFYQTYKPENINITYEETRANVSFEFDKDIVYSSLPLNKDIVKDDNTVMLFVFSDYIIRRGLLLCLNSNPSIEEDNKNFIENCKKGYSEE